VFAACGEVLIAAADTDPAAAQLLAEANRNSSCIAWLWTISSKGVEDRAAARANRR
jgi:hypothetical protein